jgi:hypothetical protein
VREDRSNRMWTTFVEKVSHGEFHGGRLSICGTECDVFHNPLLYDGQ